jgi:hypothetical protein
MRSSQRSLLSLFIGLLALIGSNQPTLTHAQTPIGQPLAITPAQTPGAVVTQHNDNSRTGANLQETILTTSNVKPVDATGTGFGKLFSRQVDGQIYAQPLFVPNVTINGVKHNVVYVATMHDSIYAFDADNPNATAPLWQTPLVNNVTTFVCPISDVTWAGDIQPEIGVLSTPVIDPVNNFLLCVTKTKELQPDGSWQYPARLRKLDIRTGKEVPVGGVIIKATVPGTGDGANGDGTLTFDPVRHMSRPGLLLQNDIVYVAFGSHGDQTPYHGWVFAFEAKYLYQYAVWCSTPNGKTDPSGYPLGAGGIWQGGMGLVGDGSNVYLETGNGTFDVNNKGIDYGDSFVKLHLNTLARPPRIDLIDYFTPANQYALDSADADLSSTGPMMIPGTNLLIGGEKSGRFFVLNSSNMGGFNAAGDTQIPQWFYAYNGELHGAPIYYDDGTNASIFVWGPYDYLKKFHFDKTQLTFNTTPVATFNSTPDWPGCSLSLSANGTKPGTGIVWATFPSNGNCILRAFDASTLNELWNSDMASDRDAVGTYTKFSVPTIADGKVFVPTLGGTLVVYGTGKWTASPTISPASGTYNQPVTVTITDTFPGTKIYYTLDGTNPTTSSTLYSGPFKVTPSVQVKAAAIASGYGLSAVNEADYVVSGAGLTGQYFNGYDNNYYPGPIQGTLALTQVDPVINFPNWSNPPAGVGPFDFAVRWTGKIEPAISGTYTFTTNSDDGVRLWVNGQLLVDDWNYQGATMESGTITLNKGTKYDIKIEYFQGQGAAVMQLFWQLPGVLGPEIVPQTQLYSK